MKKQNFINAVLFLVFFQSCMSSPAPEYSYTPPEQTQDNIQTGDIRQTGIETEPIYKAAKQILSGEYGEVHSLLVFLNGELLLEEYFPGHKYKYEAKEYLGQRVIWNRDMSHALLSVTKSIVSTCIGLAIKHGYIKSAAQSIFDYLPGYSDLASEEKRKITIKHLLTMTPGLEWKEWGHSNSSRSNDVLNIWYSQDPVRYVLEKPMLHQAGSVFNYSGGNMIVLGEILRNASGLDIEKFSEKYLFGPLGIKSALWDDTFRTGAYDTGGGLSLTPRDMLKIGITFLQNGSWQDNEILPPEWIQNSSSAFGNNTGINIPGIDDGKSGYSYAWWIYKTKIKGRTIRYYGAGGWGGQEIMVFPELNAVIVFTGGNFVREVKVFTILKKYILPALSEFNHPKVQ